jgi:hypothetical protein
VTAAAAAQPQPNPEHPPFADASPVLVCAALIPEEAAQFDREWGEVMARATRARHLRVDARSTVAVLTGVCRYRRTRRGARRTFPGWVIPDWMFVVRYLPTRELS